MIAADPAVLRKGFAVDVDAGQFGNFARRWVEISDHSFEITESIVEEPDVREGGFKDPGKGFAGTLGREGGKAALRIIEPLQFLREPSREIRQFLFKYGRHDQCTSVVFFFRKAMGNSDSIICPRIFQG